MLDRCLAYVAAGDVYQVNLSHRLAIDTAVAGLDLFRSLERRHPTRHGFYLDAGSFQVVGNSPEQYLRRTGDHLVIEPIKGTRRRGDSDPEDVQLVEELLRDPKERAEHVMIVDLERNDLGRVARTGTVRVAEHGRVETYGTLHHLVSTIEARAAPTWASASCSGRPSLADR